MPITVFPRWSAMPFSLDLQQFIHNSAFQQLRPLCDCTKAVDPFPSDLENLRLCTTSHPSRGLVTMQKNKWKSLYHKGLHVHTEKSSSNGQGWLYQAVRDITVQEGGWSSQPTYHICMSLCMTIKHRFLSCTVIPKRVGLWRVKCECMLAKIYFKRGHISSAHFSKDH